MHITINCIRGVEITILKIFPEEQPLNAICNNNKKRKYRVTVDYDIKKANIDYWTIF